MDGDAPVSTLTVPPKANGEDVERRAGHPAARAARLPVDEPTRDASRDAPAREIPGAPAGSLTKEQVAVRLFEAFNRHDLLGALELLHPQVVFQPMTAQVTQAGEPYRGHDGIRRYVRDVESYWEELIVKPVQIRAAGRAVVALGMVSGRGPGGSFENVPTTWVMKFRDGVVVQVQIFSDQRHVVEALVD
jgi:ketosteroid isomerase-like protein